MEPKQFSLVEEDKQEASYECNGKYLWYPIYSYKVESFFAKHLMVYQKKISYVFAHWTILYRTCWK